MAKEFMEFLKLYGIIGLAIAVIVGGKVNAMVTSLVNDVITPGLLQPALRAVGAANISELNISGIYYGKFLSSTIDFLIVAALVFIFSKKILKETVVAKK